MIVLFLIGWYLLGVSGFLFWWLRDYPHPNWAEIAPLMIVVGFMGPLTVPVGLFIHGRRRR